MEWGCRALAISLHPAHIHSTSQAPGHVYLADHYGGLTDTWSAGPIYCSEVTARFVVHALGVRLSYLHPLPMDTPVMIHGVEVTLVDANHCPGAVQFLFQLQDGRKYIHCGKHVSRCPGNGAWDGRRTYFPLLLE